MRRLLLFVSALLLVAPTLLVRPSAGFAQEAIPVGVAAVDVTASADCSITNRTYATRDVNSKVVDEQVWSCPAGTVLRTTPVGSKRQARTLGGIFVPLTGDPKIDFVAVRRAKARLFPTDSRSYAREQNAQDGVVALACPERSYSKSFSYWATVPGVMVYSTVYYWQDYSCASGISSSIARLGASKNLWWRFAEYWLSGGNYYYNEHGCPKLSTSAIRDTYNVRRALGGLWVDESINRGGYDCTYGIGDSYTGSVYL